MPTALLILVADDGTVTVLQDESVEAITRSLLQEAAPAVVGPLADIAPDRSYADWRTDILSLTRNDVTYFGWVNQDGCPRVGVLQGSVLTPLALPDESALAWGTPEPGAETLGRALISATLGGRAADDHLVEVFVKEVIGSLSPAGFELSATEIERWLRRQLGGQPA